MTYEHPEIEAEQAPEETIRNKWIKFVEGDLISFYHANKIEKLTIEDGFGNKARLSKTKDGDLKIEQSSTTIR